MAWDFNVDIQIVRMRGHTTDHLAGQRETARVFYAKFKIRLVTTIGALDFNPDGRDFVAAFDWATFGPKCVSGAKKGCDIFIVPKMEAIGGYQPFGLTILPDRAPPAGVPVPGVGGRPEPNPSRPAIIMNAAPLAGVPPMTLAHELGHALLDSTGHHPVSGNFMYADPSGMGDKFDATQIERLTTSKWLI